MKFYLPSAKEVEGKQFHYIVLSPHRDASPMTNLKKWDEVIVNIYRITQGKTDLSNIVNIEDEY